MTTERSKQVDARPATGAGGVTFGALRHDARGSLEIVKVFADEVSTAGASPPMRHDRRRSGRQWRIFVRAWVTNRFFAKHVWVDVALLGADGRTTYAEALSLRYWEPAGGDGEFFVLDASVPETGRDAPTSEARRLRYRLYCRADGEVFTDGILHEHPLPDEDELEMPDAPGRRARERATGSQQHPSRQRSGAAPGGV